jgi:hypothetical protein
MSRKAGWLGLGECPIGVPHATRLFAYISYAFRRSLKFILSSYHTTTLVSFCLSSTFQGTSDVRKWYLWRFFAIFWLLMRAQRFLCSFLRFHGQLPRSRISVCRESVYAWYVTLFTSHQVYILNKSVNIVVRSCVSRHFGLGASVSHPFTRFL